MLIFTKIPTVVLEYQPRKVRITLILLTDGFNFATKKFSILFALYLKAQKLKSQSDNFCYLILEMTSSFLSIFCGRQNWICLYFSVNIFLNFLDAAMKSKDYYFIIILLPEKYRFIIVFYRSLGMLETLQHWLHSKNTRVYFVIWYF